MEPAGILADQHPVIIEHDGPVEIEKQCEDCDAVYSVTYATRAEALVAARSVPADSAALYEAVNAYVDALVAELQTRHANPAISKPMVRQAHGAMLGAAMVLAQARVQQRRAQQTEPGQ